MKAVLWILLIATINCQAEKDIKEAVNIQNIEANGKAYYSYIVPDIKPYENDLFFYLNASLGEPMIYISSVKIFCLTGIERKISNWR